MKNSSNYKISGMRIEKIRSYPKSYKNNNDDLSFDLRIGVGMKTIEDNYILFVPEFHIKQDNKNIIIIKMSLEVHIEKKTWDSFLNGYEVTLPPELIQKLFAITLGAARGASLQKNNKNSLKNFVIPFIKTIDFIKEPFVLDFSNTTIAE